MTQHYFKIFSHPRTVNPGRVLMHNHIQHTAQMPNGWRGFRAWTDTQIPGGFKPCHCGWSGLPHYSTDPDYKCEEPAVIFAGIWEFLSEEKRAALLRGEQVE